MKIEVVASKSDATKDKGDLLEALATRLLTVQNYEVVTQIRLTGVELDLLCQHRVSDQELYVECKAHRDNIDANVLKNLAGTVLLKGLDQGWLITTSELGKDAKGLLREWKDKPRETKQTLSFYTPDRVLEAMINAGVVTTPPEALLSSIVPDEDRIGEWMLMISKFGTFWAVTELSGGLPAKVFCFHAKTGKPVNDPIILANLAATDTSLGELEFLPPTQGTSSHSKRLGGEVSVVEVQHGDSWDDYRPARPADFVGRRKAIDKIFALFAAIRKRERSTRVFALTGNSGMGKSSLISKLRDKMASQRYKERLFIFAVDLRAATSSEYVLSSLLSCLEQSQARGFGDSSIPLRITDLTDPLSSAGIKDYIQSLADRDQVVCLVFDQFEELSAKPDLFPIFTKAKALFLGTNSLQSNFCMGFAWKADITVSGDNPAYHMWHELEDLRATYALQPFTDGECAAALNIFEKVIDQRLHSDLRHNLLVISQGYPWLLKKLCIHLHSKIEQGVNQEQLIENRLDVGRLFDDDLQKLTTTEKSCLEYVAKSAPVDLGTVLDLFNENVVTALINKRLIVKSGDRLNIYWDIFREYLLTKKVPEIPLHYLPTNEFTSVFSIGRFLKPSASRSLKDLAVDVMLSEKTVMNISSDLVMFEIAEREGGRLLLRPDVVAADEESFLKKARQKLQRHAFTIALHKQFPNSDISLEEGIEVLKEVYPNETFADKTWRTYAQRLFRWLEVTGLLIRKGSGWLVKDLNRVNAHAAKRRRARIGSSRREVFTAPAPPDGTIAALEKLLHEKRFAKSSAYAKELRNPISILKRLELVFGGEDNFIPDVAKIEQLGGPTQAVLKTAEQLETLREAVSLLQRKPDIGGLELGRYFDEKYSMRWTDSSKRRNGNGIRRWAVWLLTGDTASRYRKTMSDDTPWLNFGPETL